MPGLLRRSAVRPDDHERSSSLPPEETPSGRGRDVNRGGRQHNPIGLSRHSTSSYAKEDNNGGGGDGTTTRDASVERVGAGRSQSLTRQGSFSEIRNGSTGIKRTDSFTSSVGSYNSDIMEPGWFSHAFHGSGACTCEWDHEGKGSCADAAAERAADAAAAANKAGGEVEGGEPRSDHDNDSNTSSEMNHTDSAPLTDYGGSDDNSSEMKRVDSYDGGNVTEATAVESGLESVTSGSCNDSAGTYKSSGSSSNKHKHSKREGRKEMGGTSTYSASSSASRAASSTKMGSGVPSGGYSDSTISSKPMRAEPVVRDAVRTTTTTTTTTAFATSHSRSSRAAASTDGNSTVTSFTAGNQSIQSELLNDGDDESMIGSLSGYRPKTLRNQKKQPQQTQHLHDSDVSSLTMDTTYLPKEKTPKKSRSFVNNVRKNTMAKIKKKSKSFHQSAVGNHEFDHSENSMDSTSSASTKSNGCDRDKRRRGRSLGLKMRRHVEKPPSNEGGNPHPYTKRRSRSQIAQRTDRDDQKIDQKARERSRSIVRDARSFMESIDKAKAVTENTKADADTGSEKKVRRSSVESRESEPRRSRGRGRETSSSFAESSVKTEESMDICNHSHTSSTIASSNVTSKNNTVTPSPSDRSARNSNNGGLVSSGVFLRNKFKDDQTLQELQELHKRQSSRDSSDTDNPLDQSEMTMQLLSSLQETNFQNEGTIQNLQEQMTDLTNERNAFRNNSERMMEIMTKQKSQLEKELRNERKGFADVSHAQKREIEEWKSKAKKMEKIDASSSLPSNASRAERNLQPALLKLSEMESKYNAQVQQLQTDNEGMKGQAHEWKEKHDQIEKQHQDLLDEHEEEAAVVNGLENKLEGFRLVIESMKKGEEHAAALTNDAASVASFSAVNDELVEKIGDLADENGQLLVKCQQLERDLSTSKSSHETSVQNLTNALQVCQAENTEAADTIETLTIENRNLRVSFANQGKNSKQMKNLVRNLRSSLHADDDAARSIADDVEKEDTNRSTKHITDMEHEEALSAIQDMQEENDALHASMEDAIKLANGMNDKMSNFATTHEDSSQDYEARVTNLKEELNGAMLSKEELTSEMDSLKKDNRKLRKALDESNCLVVGSISDEIKQEQLSKDESWRVDSLKKEKDGLKHENERLYESMKEMNSLVATAEECVSKLNEENDSLKDAQEYYEQQLQEMNVEKEANAYLREEIKSVSTEREEAYGTCKVLQQEINVLSQSVKKSRGRVERLASDGSMVSEDEKKLVELTRANDSLTRELEQKNEALQAVQYALESLKDEQSAIKETIEELRTENAKLQRQQQLALLPPPAPRSILRQSKSSSGSGDYGSDSSQILKLESRIKKVEKENKGLREANSTLSAKLFDEMEKTDALRVANEGLAARICKLVAFIQQNPGGVGGGGGVGASSPSGGVAGGNSKRSKSPAPPKKKNSFVR